MSQTLVIHGCVAGKNGEYELLAKQEEVIYYPPGRMGPEAQNAFARFGVEWAEGLESRDNFLVKIAKQEDGDQHFQLVVEGDDPKTTRFGLRRCFANGTLDPVAPTLWAQQNVEPRDWLH